MTTEKKKKTTRAVRSPKTIELDPTSEAALLALDPKMAVAPDMPVSVATREYASLARLAKSLAPDFVKIGISAEQIETLARFAKRLAALEARWQRARSAVFLSAKERKALEEAEALDNKFVAGGRWACRDDDEALAELERISAGSGLEDTLQDLRDELEFWRVHAEVLRFTDITAKDLKRAEQLVEALESAAQKEGGDVDAAAALDLRNRCFWAADKLARLIR
ncbi:hypothetical protein L6R52_27905, partial [Myxococcota bacterium]|nr:hypothetical protein [Myxococcota bacterium]